MGVAPVAADLFPIFCRFLADLRPEGREPFQRQVVTLLVLLAGARKSRPPPAAETGDWETGRRWAIMAPVDSREAIHLWECG